ncbi:unnamed protein product [Blepharisma stoltei]|uniref:Uncharacterized protein n=1 Tax=Blepharisma stoltei TaxID=1481888 RepID=A0AAU9JJI1_9CILI|nr:unnamed protein product [Blepharisma stoltei]
MLILNFKNFKTRAIFFPLNFFLLDFNRTIENKAINLWINYIAENRIVAIANCNIYLKMAQTSNEFVHLFPLLTNTLENFSRVLNADFQISSRDSQELKSAYRRWKNECNHVIQENCWGEIMNIIPNEWSKLNRLSNRVGNHTVRLMLCMYKDQEFKILDNHDKNLLIQHSRQIPKMKKLWTTQKFHKFCHIFFILQN